MRYHALGFRKALKLLLAWLWSTLWQRHVRRPCSNIDKQGKLICSNIYTYTSPDQDFESWHQGFTDVQRWMWETWYGMLRWLFRLVAQRAQGVLIVWLHICDYLRLQYRLRFEVVCGCINLQPRQIAGVKVCWMILKIHATSDTSW